MSIYTVKLMTVSGRSIIQITMLRKRLLTTTETARIFYSFHITGEIHLSLLRLFWMMVTATALPFRQISVLMWEMSLSFPKGR